MKKIILLLFPILTSFAASGCSTIDSRHSVLPLINYDTVVEEYENDVDYVESAYDLTPLRLYELMDSKASFPLFLYSDYCSHCNDFKPILGKYIKNMHYQMYRFSIKSEDDRLFFVNQILKDFPDTFENYTANPSFYFIADGKLTYSVQPNKFASYQSFASVANKHFFKSQLYTVNTLDGLKYYLNDYNETLLYCYDDSSLVSIELYKIIYQKMINNTNKNVLILNKNMIDEEEYKSICEYLDFKIDEDFSILYSKDEQQKTADYVSDGGVLYKQFLINYFH